MESLAPAFVTVPAQLARETTRSLQPAAPAAPTATPRSPVTALAVGLVGGFAAAARGQKAKARAATALRASVDEYIKEHDIVAFITPTCPFCQAAVAALKESGYPPFIVEVQPGSALRSEVAEKTGSTSVPKVWVKGNFVGGCNDGGMGGVKPLLKSGKIQELMS
ncbi:unnamed protein product [Effrenium voratum]|nr:unnamed protein product [Effrenium voratum]|mmetsp:Transcript_118749/g.281792  ORF Transcript_118749/g.281792 Transcript_118749/m.281792 type:complete len:165 (+) Transcript_118749:63-557(+)